ncbi:MAG: IS1595 family transposase [Thermoanaerobaculaceae bacterium]|jgi:transposase-like protein
MNSDPGLIGFMKRFPTDEACRRELEARRWPNGPVCPHCEGGKGSYLLKGKTTRPGTYKCRSCRKQFAVTVGTIFEGSHIGLQKWFLVVYLMGSSKKGMSAHQIHRSLDVTYETAWFMCHRIRHAMRTRAFRGFLSGTVEADETYVGGKTKGGKRGRGAPNKTIVFGMVERGGDVHAMAVPDVKKSTLHPIIQSRVVPGSRLMTDELYSYRGLGQNYEHGFVEHAREYVTGKDIHVNTQESFWALLKRGVVGTFHHISKDKMDWYCGEFGFRYNTRKVTDGERFTDALTNCDGRLRWYFKAEQAA